MKLSGKFYKRAKAQVYVDVETDAIGQVWIDTDKTSDIDWKTLSAGDRVVFTVTTAAYQKLIGEEVYIEPKQGELFDETSELQNDSKV